MAVQFILDNWRLRICFLQLTIASSGIFLYNRTDGERPEPDLPAARRFRHQQNEKRDSHGKVYSFRFRR